MAADIKTIKKIADLAAIFIEENELEAYAAQLDTIINYMEELKNLDIGDTKPMEHILQMNNVFREDKVTGQNMRNELIKNANIAKDGYFKVPAVVDLL
ncbi:MAG: Asp-tRNA(Asn)/Glu-tRNA(Gln) amidotransferase subunit GatC [Acetivibrionales bacterium]|jgi:aspartyl-tRNA(Asn)/glutamyl-tRNA(Gln) amidotransferase subunit C|nr:Asp-tRNA(Asn)/Glu-tRNA(Gln) amidotransferase subunit GatC [Clostridiaceae bacterium]